MTKSEVYKFPEGFMWGTATSGYQIEGGNWNSDIWEIEHTPGSGWAESSGDACDHYHRYLEDIKIMSELGFNTFRFSIEWSRIEPEDGEFSIAALNHYQLVCEALLENKITPIITLNHCTLPRWVHKNGGWLWNDIPKRFGNYSKRVAKYLSNNIKYIITINEPNLIAAIGYKFGHLPSGYVAKQRGVDPDKAAKTASTNLIKAHHASREAIKECLPDMKVGCALFMAEWGVREGCEELLKKVQEMWEVPFFEAVKKDDFIGVQTYTRFYVGTPDLPNTKIKCTFPRIMICYPPGTRMTICGWEFRPGVLDVAIRRVYKHIGLPIFITENGCPTDNDDERIEYIEGALKSLAGCIKDGINIIGYLHWSLLDNFEWHIGYKAKFGLVAVDRKTFKRTVKPSGYLLGRIAKNNAVRVTI